MAYEVSVSNSLRLPYDSFVVSQDGEPDDFKALNILASVAQGMLRPLVVDCTIGNRKITLLPKQDWNEDEEIQARVLFANEILGVEVAIPGAKTKTEVSDQYIARICQETLERQCLALHTNSFVSLQELLATPQPKGLDKLTILSYGSVNWSWAMDNIPKEKKAEKYTEFYETLSKSGAKLVLVEAFPFLADRNKLTPANTPLTYSLLPYLNGPAGKRWCEFSEKTTQEVRGGQAKKVAEYICNATNTATGEEQEKLKILASKITELFGQSIGSAEATVENLQSILSKGLDPETHHQLEADLKEIRGLISSVLKIDQDIVNRTFNVYAGTALQGQALIADQIPAIMFSELVEGRKGLVDECLPVEFSKFENFAVYSVKEVQKPSLFYLNTAVKADQRSVTKADLIDDYLRYIDLSMTVAFLVNDQMINPEKRAELLSSDIGTKLVELAKQVQKFGFDLPRRYSELVS